MIDSMASSVFTSIENCTDNSSFDEEDCGKLPQKMFKTPHARRSSFWTQSTASESGSSYSSRSLDGEENDLVDARINDILMYSTHTTNQNADSNTSTNGMGQVSCHCESVGTFESSLEDESYSSEEDWGSDDFEVTTDEDYYTDEDEGYHDLMNLLQGGHVQPSPKKDAKQQASQPMSLTESKALLQNLCGGFKQQIGSSNLLGNQGQAILQRAKVLASINFLSSHLPNCVMNQLGKEVKEQQLVLPYKHKYQCALLFVDISGFTKLSTLMDPENLSKVINTYFQLLVDKVEEYGGDIQKYAGDGIFVEWRASESNKLEHCVGAAAACAASMVQEYSDYHVLVQSSESGSVSANNASAFHTLNIHCGLGVGNMTSIHVGNNTQRREYLYFGQPITQATNACDKAKPGEAAVSSQFLAILEEVLDETCGDDGHWNSAVVIATKSTSMVETLNATYSQKRQAHKSRGITHHVEGLELNALKQYRQLMSLYVHPVAVMNDVAARDDFGSTLTSTAAATRQSASSRTGSLQEQRREDAELRNVYVIFIKPIFPEAHENLNTLSKGSVSANDIRMLNDVMNVTSRELAIHKGHMRQFIVDDKGFVMIATFGLRGSTFPNMVTERALPATLALHKSFTTELGIDCRIGATFGDVYCGNVGGEQRQEFAVMGPSVNLAARLMCSPGNTGILVDSAIRNVASKVYNFQDLEPIVAKGYSEPVCIYEPISPITNEESSSKVSSTEEVILYRMDTLDITARTALNVGAVLGDTFTLDEVDSALQEKRENKPESRNETLASLEHAVREGILSAHHKEGNTTYSFESPIWRSTLLNIMLAARKKDVHKKIALNLEATQSDEESIESGKKLAVHWMCAGNASKATSAVLAVCDKIVKQNGMTQECLEMYEDALRLWGWEQGGASSVGGLPPKFVRVLKVEQLEDIFSLMVARGRFFKQTGASRKSMEAFKDVLQIKESWMAVEALPDISITFPAYDGVIEALSLSRSSSDAKYELKLIEDFLQATTSSRKMIHHVHALYLKIRYFYRTAQFEKAASVHVQIQGLYKPEVHSEGLRKFYGKDSGALSYAINCQSELALHKAKDALSGYKHIIQDILPKINSDFSQSFEIAYRMVWILKTSGCIADARTLFHRVVGDSVNHVVPSEDKFLKSIFRTIDLLLTLTAEDCVSDDTLDEMFNVVSQYAESSDFHEDIKIQLGQMGRCADSISAEILLLLAKQTSDKLMRSNLKSRAFHLLSDSLAFLTNAGFAAAGKEVQFLLDTWKDFE